MERNDLPVEHRQKCNAELNNARNNFQKLLHTLAATQHNAGSGGGGSGGGSGGFPGANGGVPGGMDFQLQQRLAITQAEMSKRAAAAAAGGNQATGPYRVASPSGYANPQPGGGPLHPPPPSGLRQSPSLNPSSLPGASPTANIGSPANNVDLKKLPTPMIPNNNGNVPPKKLTKKQQQVADAAAAAVAQAMASGKAQNAMALAQQHQQQVPAPPTGASTSNSAPNPIAPAPVLPNSGSTTTYLPLQPPHAATNPSPIPNQLNMPPPIQEAFQPPRPTLMSGLAAPPVVSTPAITQPGFNAEQVANALGKREAPPVAGGAKKDTREDSKGRTVSKRKIRELVESVDPDERLNDDVEDVGFSSF